MSKLETPLTRAYWASVGGTLVEEFLAIRRGPDQGPRLIDAVIILGTPRRTAHWRDVDLIGKDIIAVQTKASRLGMYLMGQALFSAELMKQFRPASIRTVAICTRDDAVLRPIAEQYGIEVVVMPKKGKPDNNESNANH
jgi:hypothetical protein